MSLSTVLGLSKSPDIDWDRIRALQAQGTEKYLVGRLANNLVMGIALVAALFSSQNIFLLGGWFLCLVIYSICSFSILQKSELWQQKKVSKLEAKSVVLHSVGGALVWSLALLIFGISASQFEMTLILVVTSLLMMGTTMVVQSLPHSALASVTLLGVAQVTASLFFMTPVVAVICAVFTIFLVLAALQNSQNAIRYKISEAGIGEKNEVVSLLLKEFEESGADWLWQTDKSRRVIHASPRFAFALGAEPTVINGTPFLELMAGDAWESGKFPSSLHDLAERMKRRDSFSAILVPVRINGQMRWWELSASPRLDEDGSFLGFRGVGSDVTEQRESAEKISQLARFDTLTGLPNRLQLMETLAKAMETAEKWKSRCAFIMIDLDRFKAVNDTLGHPVGDRLLASVSERLKKVMSDNELCGRLGGDEFAIVVKDASDTAKISRLAQKIIDTLSQPYEVDQHSLYIGASIGTALGPRDGRTVEMLVRSADLALYRSKDEGGGCHTYYEPKLHVHAEERRLMEMALRKALERDEFSVNYQPVVDAMDGSILGFEALVRWANPDFGNVSPAKFIPIAEDARLIEPIGEWVLRTACKEAMNWPDSVKVAVNASVDQLCNPHFVNVIRSALAESGLPTHRLEIEVTEGIFLREGSCAEQVLDNILAMGINLSLDDFGTGYSSLGYLRKTKFSTIKVDRSFVVGAAKNIPESLAIIRAVVAMADALGMSTTAEGAETEEEVAMIQELGCRKIQGYYFGRPMPANEARKLFGR